MTQLFESIRPKPWTYSVLGEIHTVKEASPCYVMITSLLFYHSKKMTENQSQGRNWKGENTVPHCLDEEYLLLPRKKKKKD